MFRRRQLPLLFLSACLLLAAPAQERTEVKETAAQRAYRSHRGPQIARAIRKILSDKQASRGFWGIQVVSLDTGKTLFELDPDKLFTPASNTKLFTTATALATLGPDFRFQTTLESSGAMDSSGRLQGDLLLVGRGDPNLSNRVLPYQDRSVFDGPRLRVLEALADQLTARGVKVVEGDVIGDDSFFAFQRYPQGWAQDDLMWPDGAPVSALTLHDNTQGLVIAPGAAAGEKAVITLNPDVAYYDIDNRTVTSAGNGPREIGMDRQPGSRTLVVWGAIPMSDPGMAISVALEDPAEFAAQALRTLLQQRGIKITGRTRAQHTLTATLPITALQVDKNSLTGKGGADEPAYTASTGRTVLATYESTPLLEDLRVINKVSQNLHAELVLRVMGRRFGTAPTLEGALAAEQGVLDQAGIGRDEYDLFDGSGLSQQNLVSPRAVVKLLLWADQQPWAADFRSTLPVSGQDGTLADRLRVPASTGRVQAKTGTLSFVNSLSGYLETAKGVRLAFSIFANHHPLTSAGGKQVIDAIVKAIANDKPPARRAKKKSKS
ncbi:MAG: D-alanyl-D-alanine carboxypeptidase/D-alanyl-D-alanine-endopeptidase [Acidobacteriales bacterium]|nr:D-alanyl-D-alanine carboxypeptidase/D-alanyl-D-alanine-endopeptidase [Terriglobales bacterium]